jgi:glutamate dehydrogenase
MPDIHSADDKASMIDRVVALAAARPTPPLGAPPLLEAFLRHFYLGVPPQDLVTRTPEALLTTAMASWDFLQARKPGAAHVRVATPSSGETGPGAPRTIVDVANDDMPFLVDSVLAALNALDGTVELIVHPVVQVVRDGQGRLVAFVPPGDHESAAAPSAESLMHIELAGAIDAVAARRIADTLDHVLLDLRAAVVDWAPMVKVTQAVADSLGTPGLPVSATEASEVAAFLSWLVDDQFTFLGYREYAIGDTGMSVVAGSGRGLLRDDSYRLFDGVRDVAQFPPDLQQFLESPQILMISKSNRRSTVHRPVQLDTVGVKSFDAEGRLVGQRVIVGLFTSSSYNQPTHTIPVLRRKVMRTLDRARLAPDSHDGKALRHILDTYPRDELFQISEADLFATAMGILHLQDRARVALFVRRDPFGRFASCIVYVPRERYSSETRRRIARILGEAFQGTPEIRSTHLDEAVLARLHFIVAASGGNLPVIDIAAVEARIATATRTWSDVLEEALVGDAAGPIEAAVVRRYRDAFPTSYTERMSGAAALADIAAIDRVLAGEPIALALIADAEGEAGRLVLKTYRKGEPIVLSDILPILENLGFRVISELPFEVRPEGAEATAWLQEFLLETRDGGVVAIDDLAPRFGEAFPAIWFGMVDDDGFNRLVTSAGLTVRQTMVLRCYVKFLRQAGTTFSQGYIESVLSGHPEIARLLVRLFETRFDVDFTGDRTEFSAEIVSRLVAELDHVTSLDEDRILRALMQLVLKTLRTNYYQRAAEGGPKPYLSIKLASREIDLLPLPRPMVEIFVYSARMEGVHLRGGKVARGGIRWSDRREDFRTEILGLMKAQQVKNAVIVPLGSKGGFVVKRMPAGDRAAVMAEVVACYRTLMCGMLDLTDNITGPSITAPARTICHDDSDPYLVVAADKGTATFSDIANGIAQEYGFWLGDAFASGGSVGYDHKAMGITAKGAWEAVKRHFREIGTDIQTADFTCIGVGDMSGDVFGNGMLLSRHTRLLAAFDHRHIFLDPDPEAAASWQERKRLFDLPRSSWADFDRKLISPGGGVYERTAKIVTLSAQAQARFGLQEEALSPQELIQALLRQPVDLLWFGGIGTYVKASTERNAEVGDKANDAVRVDARQLRATIIGEGANLAVTQRGRIEYALRGGRLNTDAIDNSAGVDTSDHEVNIKIALAGMIESGALAANERVPLLTAMTGSVEALVLRDNYLQTLALSLSEAEAPAHLDRHIRAMRELERVGKLDRAVEFLPDDEALAQRQAAKRGLTRPELAVLLAYAKNDLSEALHDTDLADDPMLDRDLTGYFPPEMVARSQDDLERHRLRREIVVNVVVNDLVNRMGISFVSELRARTGRDAAAVTRAYRIVREVFDLDRLWAAVEALDGKVSAAVQIELLLSIRHVAGDAARWLLSSGKSLDIGSQIARFKPAVATLCGALRGVLPASARTATEARRAALLQSGIPASLAEPVVALENLVGVLDVVPLDEASGITITELAKLYFAAAERLGIARLRGLTTQIATATPWQRNALADLLDDLATSLHDIVAAIAQQRGDSFDAIVALEAWIAARPEKLRRLAETILEIARAAPPDLAMLMVAVRQFQALR